MGALKRKLSWLFGGLAYVAPPTWAYFEQVSVYSELEAQYGYVCGLPALAIVALASLLASFLALVALFLGWSSFRELPKPRAKMRLGELGVLAMPLLLPMVFVAFLFAY